MKYIVVFIFIILTGCNEKEIEIKNVQDINYKEISFLENDYDNILKNINGEYNETNKINGDSTIIEITNDNDINTFYITPDKIYTKINDTIYYKDNSDFLALIDTMYMNYTNSNFLNIEYYNNFIYDKNKFNIKLDNTNNNYELVLTDTIYNFKINKLSDNEAVDLLYNIDVIDNRNIVIRTNDEIEISFETKHNFLVTISKNNDTFITNISQKK